MTLNLKALSPELRKRLGIKPRNKYRVADKESRTHEGITHDSRGEMKRWRELQLQERSKLIFNLRRQVKYPLNFNGVAICTYEADFEYQRQKALPNGGMLVTVVEDFKGMETPVFKIKKRLMLACHGIEVLVTKTKC